MRSIFSKLGTKLSKLGTKLSKTRTKLSKTQSNGRTNLRNLIKQSYLASEPHITAVFYTPRFSYSVLETTVSGYEHGSGTVCQRVRGYGYGTRWVPGRGIPGG